MVPLKGDEAQTQKPPS